MTGAGAPAQSTRPRVLMPVTIHFAIRYIVRTGLLERLRAVCDPIVALSWDDPDVEADLRGEGVEVVRLPTSEMSPAVSSGIAELDACFARRLRSPSTSIDLARRHTDRPLSIRLRRRLTWQRNLLSAMVPGAEERRRTTLEQAIADGTNIEENLAFLRDRRIDAIFSVTPFVAQEFVVLHAAKRLGLPTCTSILSFDNITTRPPLPIRFDRYIVWNRFNADELQRGYPGLGNRHIAITGPAQFDFYGRPELVAPATAWRSGIGLPEGVPTVLFGAGPPSVSPHESQYLDDLIEGIADGRLPADLHIVLRRHPNDLPDRWEPFRAHPAVRFDDPGSIGGAARPGQVNMGTDQISGLCSTLSHTDVHVNVSSTMTLDGAFFDKPQIGPAYDRTGAARHRRRAIDLYRREHFIPIVASGGLELARSPEQLVEQVRCALDRPERFAKQRRAMLVDMCSFLDFAATGRVADEVARFLGDHVVTGRDRAASSVIDG